MGVESGTTKDDFSDYFTRTILTAIRDKTSTLVVDVGLSKPQVAGSKDISSFLQTYLYWLELKLSNEDVISSLLDGADRLVSLGELDAAALLYGKCRARADSSHAAACALDPNRPLALFLVVHKVQAMYGKAGCEVRELRARDKYVKYPNTLKHLLAALRLIQAGMAIILDMKDQNKREELAWLLINGTTSKWGGLLFTALFRSLYLTNR